MLCPHHMAAFLDIEIGQTAQRRSACRQTSSDAGGLAAPSRRPSAPTSTCHRLGPRFARGTGVLLCALCSCLVRAPRRASCVSVLHSACGHFPATLCMGQHACFRASAVSMPMAPALAVTISSFHDDDCTDRGCSNWHRMDEYTVSISGVCWEHLWYG